MNKYASLAAQSGMRTGVAAKSGGGICTVQGGNYYVPRAKAVAANAGAHVVPVQQGEKGLMSRVWDFLASEKEEFLRGCQDVFGMVVRIVSYLMLYSAIVDAMKVLGEEVVKGDARDVNDSMIAAGLLIVALMATHAMAKLDVSKFNVMRVGVRPFAVNKVVIALVILLMSARSDSLSIMALSIIAYFIIEGSGGFRTFLNVMYDDTGTNCDANRVVSAAWLVILARDIFMAMRVGLGSGVFFAFIMYVHTYTFVFLALVFVVLYKRLTQTSAVASPSLVDRRYVGAVSQALGLRFPYSSADKIRKILTFEYEYTKTPALYMRRMALYGDAVIRQVLVQHYAVAQSVNVGDVSTMIQRVTSNDTFSKVFANHVDESIMMSVSCHLGVKMTADMLEAMIGLWYEENKLNIERDECLYSWALSTLLQPCGYEVDTVG